MREIGTVIRARVRPPPLPSPLVPRPRIEQLLGGLVAAHQHVCISATAGAGKTTAVLQAAHTTGRPIAWLSTDHTDAATGQLMVYLEAAVAGAVPEVAAVATAAMAAGAPHEEVAGLLAEAIGEAPVLVVLDDLERLVDAPEALAVLGAFLRYLPPSARAVLIGRQEIPIDLGSAAIRRIAGLGETDLAFTTEETAAALAAAGSTGIDPTAAVQATGGWVAGVMFEAWRSADHVPGMGGEADPLHGYLSTQILDQLTAPERDFLVLTSVLEQVTADSATALGVVDAVALIRAVRRRHLPASWDPAGTTLRCHPRFREFLLELLERCPTGQVGEVRRRHGAMLLRSGHPEEAVTELIAAGALEDALTAAQRCISTVVDRADLQRAEQWLAALAPVRRTRTVLAPAELMVAVAQEDYLRAVRLADELTDTGELTDVAGSSSRAGAAMAWCYLHTGDLHAARAVLTLTAPGPPRDAMRYCLTLVADEPPGTPPARALSGGSFDALVMRVHYYRGYFALVTDHPLEGWAARVGESWRIGAMLDMGRTAEALELFDAVGDSEKGAWLSVILGGHLMVRLGRPEEARRVLREGRERLRRCGTVMLEMISHVEEAELELQLGDTAAARTILTGLLRSPVGIAYRFIHERARTALGRALLLDSADAEAAACLRDVVDEAWRNDRIYSLPAAGVCLAEAEWRLGRTDAADQAADLALEAAHRQGSHHLLLEALHVFPEVLSRRIDTEPDRDSAWHTLGRALSGRRDAVPATGNARVVLTEFGRMAICVDGTEVRPRIKKSYELLAYLTCARGAQASRAQLLDVLFDGRADPSAAAYLRQAVHQLRLVLPPGVTLTIEEGRIRIAADAPVTSESIRLEELLAQAGALRGEDRLAGLRDALRCAERGEYLPGVRSEWAENRRRHLVERVAAARFEAAQTAFALGHHDDAEELLAAVLAADPLREPAWRLAMRLADALGDENRVLTHFRDCERELAQIGMTPSAATMGLLNALHR